MRDLRDHLLDLARIVSAVRDRATGHRRVRLGRLADMIRAALEDQQRMGGGHV